LLSMCLLYSQSLMLSTEMIGVPKRKGTVAFTQQSPKDAPGANRLVFETALERDAHCGGLVA
jgi:hypothetical protein